ncbi:MAG: hypothetical protein Q7S00_00880 [bacterium]|nr:hypothetical protein [bacterium]
MKQPDFKKMSCEEIAAFICSHLNQQKVSAILTGGACVTIYSKNLYKSGDLDFISDAFSNKELDPFMKEIGFKRTSSRHYEHPDCPYFVEFPPGPLSVGSELIKTTATRKTKYGILSLLTPEDSVKDRLAAFYHWNDRQALEQATLICRQHLVDLKIIESWSKKEGALEKYQYFLKTVSTG